MRVAVICPGYAPVLGGVEVVATALCERMAGLGLQIEVLSQDRSVVSPTTETRHGVTVRRFPATKSMRFSISPTLWRYVHRYGRSFDLLHLHSYHSAANLGVVFARGLPPIVFNPHYHGTGHTKLAMAAHLPWRLAGNRLVGMASSIVSVSQAEFDLISRDFPRQSGGKTTVIHNAVHRAVLSQAVPWPDAPPTVLILGRIESYKGIDTAIAAFEHTTGVSQLVIAGDGPHRATLEQMALKSSAAKRIKFLGRVSDAELHRWLRTANAVLSLSTKEAFGLVGMEGVAAGAAALLSDIPAHREVARLLPAERVTLVALGNQRELIEQLQLVLDSRPGEPVDVRDWDEAANEYLAIYNDLVCSARRNQS